MGRPSFLMFRYLAKSWGLVLGIFFFVMLGQDKAQADEYLSNKVEQLEKTLQIYIEENTKLRAQIKSLTENKVSPTTEATTPTTARDSCENSLTTCSDEDLCETATYSLLGNKNWKVGSYERFVDEAKKRGLTCEVALASASNMTDQSTASTTTPTTARDSCENSLTTCSDEDLCETATYSGDGGKDWKVGSYERFVVEAKKRGLTCEVADNLATGQNEGAHYSSNEPDNGNLVEDETQSCGTNISFCTDQELCEHATFTVLDTKNWKMNNPYEFVDGICKGKVICAQKTNSVLEAGNWLVKEPNQFVIAAKEKGLTCNVPNLSNFSFDQKMAVEICNKRHKGLVDKEKRETCLQKEEQSYLEIFEFVESVEDEQRSGLLIQNLLEETNIHGYSMAMNSLRYLVNTFIEFQNNLIANKYIDKLYEYCQKRVISRLQPMRTAASMNVCLSESNIPFNDLNDFLLSNEVLPKVYDFCAGRIDFQSIKDVGKNILCMHQLTKEANSKNISEDAVQFCLDRVSENFLYSANEASACMRDFMSAMTLPVATQTVALCRNGTKNNGALYRGRDFVQCMEDNKLVSNVSSNYSCTKARDNELTQAEMDAVIPKVLSTARSLGWIWEGQKFDSCNESATQSDTLRIIPTRRPDESVYLHYRKSKNGFVYSTIGDNFKVKYRGCYSFTHKKSFTCTNDFIHY